VTSFRKGLTKEYAIGNILGAAMQQSKTNLICWKYNLNPWAESVGGCHSPGFCLQFIKGDLILLLSVPVHHP